MKLFNFLRKTPTTTDDTRIAEMGEAIRNAKRQHAMAMTSAVVRHETACIALRTARAIGNTQRIHAAQKEATAALHHRLMIEGH